MESKLTAKGCTFAASELILYNQEIMHTMGYTHSNFIQSRDKAFHLFPKSTFKSRRATAEVENLEMIEYGEQKPFLKIEYDSKASIYNHFGSFMIREEEEELQHQELPRRVQYMGLQDFKCPVKLEEAFHSLRGLSISKSPKIVYFPEASLLSQLRFMVIKKKCNALQSLPTENLSISYCDSLTCTARVQLPPNLKRLQIWHCSNLVTVLDEEEVSGSTPNLEDLKIEHCPSLTSLWSKASDPIHFKRSSFQVAQILLEYFLVNVLPKSLEQLEISRCPLLEERSEEAVGVYWPTYLMAYILTLPQKKITDSV